MRYVFAVVIALTQLGSASSQPIEAPRPEFVFLDNGVVRIGVKPSSGGAIAYFSESNSTDNLLNHYDHGRLVQQSYYGKPDGTFWAGQPWRWNPVQGGDYKGGAAKLLDLSTTPTSLTTRSLARHWSGCVDLEEVIFEQSLSLDGPIVHVRFRMTYSGAEVHPPAHQEIPAIFVEPQFDTLVLYEGKRPWTDDDLSSSKPGWPNESRHPTEHWAAYVNDEKYGIGAYVPMASELTCYRFSAGRSSEQGACSYFAPLTTFAVTRGLKFEYDLHLTAGTIEQIRARFKALHEQAKDAE